MRDKEDNNDLGGVMFTPDKADKSPLSWTIGHDECVYDETYWITRGYM